MQKAHGMNHATYKFNVNELRKQGKIPEARPTKVKVVDMDFRYKKVSARQDFLVYTVTYIFCY